jgi:hypothetical protein
VTAIGTRIDLNSPRTIGQILGAALRLYARLPFLFMFLAAIVVVPYEVVVALLTHGKAGLSLSSEAVLLLVGLALINPCVAALQVQALVSIGAGDRLDLADVIRRGLVVLPVVAAADIVAGIGIAIGALIFVIPGVILAIRWAVVAPVAALERTDWPTALRRSGQLARHNYWRILGILVVVAVVNELPAGLTRSPSSLGTTIAAIVVATIVHSFITLIVNILYFDLRARAAAPVA